MRSSTLGPIALILLFATSCAQDENIIPKPVISVSNEMTTSWNGYINGQTYGVDPHLYYLVMYAKIDNLWSNLPSAESPAIPITQENEWTCQLETLDITTVSEIFIYLLPNRVSLPILENANNIPPKLSLISAAKYHIILNGPPI